MRYQVQRIVASGMMILILGGCASPEPDDPFWTDIPSPAPTPDVDSPPDPVEPPSPPEPTVAFESGLMPVEQVSVRALGPAPSAVEARVMGTLGDACTEFERVEQMREGDTVTLTLWTRRPIDMLCGEMARTYERVVRLEGSYAAGEYRLVANDYHTTFSVPGEDDGQWVDGLAFVDDVQVMVMESFPAQVALVISGWLPDGCTELDEVKQTREGNTIRVTMTTRRPAEAFCTLALVTFTENVRLEGTFLPGEYVAIVNDFEVRFRVD